MNEIFEEVSLPEETAEPEEESSPGVSEDLSSEQERIPQEDSLETSEEETSAPAPVQIHFPDDYLDIATYREGVEELISEIALLIPEEPEEELLSDVPVGYAAADPELPYDAVFFTVEGRTLLFPASYADDVHVLDGQLVNLGSSYTAGVVLPSAPVSNYIVSEITFPTYHSSTWYQYLNTYGQPYRVVDRYRSSGNSYSSYTRPSVSLSFSGGNDWAGFGIEKIFLFIIIVILVIREVIKWLTS